MRFRRSSTGKGVRKMNKFVTVDKRSKKAQKEYYSQRRHTWGELNPVTRSVPSGKTYNRKKEKKRAGREFRDDLGAGSFAVSLMTTMKMP